jgi:RNA-directed DNA polymerase
VYTSLRRNWQPPERTPASLFSHDQESRAFLDDYHQVVRKEVDTDTDQIPANIKDQLWSCIADARNLRAAWDTLSRHGGQAPGPNGDTYADFSDSEAWDLLRSTSQAVKVGTYRPGPTKKVPVPKSSGRGTRTLQLANIQDRVVDRAILQIIQPLYEPRFDDRSYGFRPRRDRRHALAAAERITIDEGRTVWLVDDIKDCFDHIPRGRLYQVLEQRLPAAVMTLIKTMCESKHKQGLRLG